MKPKFPKDSPTKKIDFSILRRGYAVREVTGDIFIQGAGWGENGLLRDFHRLFDGKNSNNAAFVGNKAVFVGYTAVFVEDTAVFVGYSAVFVGNIFCRILYNCYRKYIALKALSTLFFL